MVEDQLVRQHADHTEQLSILQARQVAGDDVDADIASHLAKIKAIEGDERYLSRVAAVAADDARAADTKPSVLDLTDSEKRDKVAAAIRNLASQRLDAEISAVANQHDKTLPPHTPLTPTVKASVPIGAQIICPACGYVKTEASLGQAIEALKTRYAELLDLPAKASSK